MQCKVTALYDIMAIQAFIVIKGGKIERENNGKYRKYFSALTNATPILDGVTVQLNVEGFVEYGWGIKGEDDYISCCIRLCTDSEKVFNDLIIIGEYNKQWIFRKDKIKKFRFL